MGVAMAGKMVFNGIFKKEGKTSDGKEYKFWTVFFRDPESNHSFSCSTKEEELAARLEALNKGAYGIGTIDVGQDSRSYKYYVTVVDFFECEKGEKFNV